MPALDARGKPLAQWALPLAGSQVSGTVVRFVEDWLAIVEIVAGGARLEARLPREKLPEQTRTDIRIALAVGDRVKAMVDTVDHMRLRIGLDLTAWRAAMRGRP